MKHYLIVSIGMTDPEVVAGPFDNNDELIKAARKLVMSGQYELGSYGEDALFWLDVDQDGTPVIGSFSGGFMDDIREMSPNITESEKRLLDGNR